MEEQKREAKGNTTCATQSPLAPQPHTTVPIRSLMSRAGTAHKFIQNCFDEMRSHQRQSRLSRPMCDCDDRWWMDEMRYPPESVHSWFAAPDQGRKVHPFGGSGKHRKMMLMDALHDGCYDHDGDDDCNGLHPFVQRANGNANGKPNGTTLQYGNRSPILQHNMQHVYNGTRTSTWRRRMGARKV